MKSGAGDDPFGDLVSDERASSRAEDEDSEANDEPDAAESSDVSSTPSPAATAGQPSEDSDGVGEADTDAALDLEDLGEEDGIPWILRRRSVKDDRPNVTQFFLRDETDRAERRFRGEVEERLDTDVYLLDLREAAYVVAMQHPEEVASLLGRWGYDYRD